MAFVAMSLRVYVRLRIVKSFGWDDACMVAAMVRLVMWCTVQIESDLT